MDGIELAEIFGSWAARMHGEAGPNPSDIDLLVVGRPSRDDLFDAVARASRTLGRQVNPVVMSRKRWDTGDDALIREIGSRPRVTVVPVKREPQ